MKLFWVESIDHGEDWFVVASDELSAAKLFADELGFDIIHDQIQAEEVCSYPPTFKAVSAGFCNNQDILVCGGEFIEFHDQDLLQHVTPEFLHQVAGETRIVRFGKKVYMEGNILRVALQLEGKISKS